MVQEEAARRNHVKAEQARGRRGETRARAVSLRGGVWSRPCLISEGERARVVECVRGEPQAPRRTGERARERGWQLACLCVVSAGAAAAVGAAAVDQEG